MARWWTRSWVRLSVAALGGCLAAALLASVAFSVRFSGDYSIRNPVGGDNAAPGIAALVHGDVGGYLEHQPIIGLSSILVRVPFVAVAAHLGAGNLDTYKVGALACLLPLALLAAWMVSRPGLSPSQRLIRLLAVLLVIQSPSLRNTLEAGHPEGALSNVLAVAAVLAAMGGRARSAALLLGLAIAAKESAVTAVPQCCSRSRIAGGRSSRSPPPWCFCSSARDGSSTRARSCAPCMAKATPSS
jgi:hypothetical protein